MTLALTLAKASVLEIFKIGNQIDRLGAQVTE